MKLTWKKIVGITALCFGVGTLVSCYGMPLDEDEVIEEPVMYGMPPNLPDDETEENPEYKETENGIEEVSQNDSKDSGTKN